MERQRMIKKDRKRDEDIVKQRERGGCVDFINPYIYGARSLALIVTSHAL